MIFGIMLDLGRGYGFFNLRKRARIKSEKLQTYDVQTRASCAMINFF